jgi:hypothetical protein
MKVERNHTYNFFLIIERKVLVLEDEDIIDANLNTGNKSDNKLILSTEDDFFIFTMSKFQNLDFMIVLQIYETDGSFSHQFELGGEFFEIKDKTIIFEFETISTNHVYPSISPYWKDEIELYKSDRVSYIRNSIIENILI